MKVAVLGLGYVGTVSAVCLTEIGHTVIGVDVSEEKVNQINEKKSPILEPGIDELLEKAVANKLLKATINVEDAISESDVSLICVGTPSGEDGSIDLSHIKDVAADIGKALKEKSDYHVVITRSTVLPGSNNDVIGPILESESGKKLGSDIGLCMNPEFLREASAVTDFFNPPFTLIGEFDEKSGNVVAELYDKLDAPVYKTGLKESEMVKYVTNTWHALKVSFANEIGRICKNAGLDSFQVMDIFLKDKKLNISEAYLKPGFAFGGSCLPKDVRALLALIKSYEGEKANDSFPLLHSILQSNNETLNSGIKMVMNSSAKNIGIVGLSFKKGTDDVRESPLVLLIEALQNSGKEVRVYDEDVHSRNLVGRNLDYLKDNIPNIEDIFVKSVEDLLEHSEVLVIGKNYADLEDKLMAIENKPTLIDLVGLNHEFRKNFDNYEGIGW